MKAWAWAWTADGRREVATVTYRCGHEQVHCPAGDVEDYQQRIAQLECGACEIAERAHPREAMT